MQRDAIEANTIKRLPTRHLLSLQAMTLCMAATLFVAGSASAGIVAYVPNQGNSTASIVDTGTQTQTGIISGLGGAYSAAVAPNGSIAYVADFNNARIFPINTSTNVAGTPITVGAAPLNVTFSADSAAAYVSNYTSNSISVINVAAGTVTTTVPNVCPAGAAQPIQSVFNGTKLLIVCNGGTSKVISMDTGAGNALTTLATVGSTAYNIAISTASGFGYVSNYGSATVSKFDLTSGATTNYATTGVNSPLGIAVTPDGSKIFVGDYAGSNMIVMGPTGAVNATLNLAAATGIAGIGISKNGGVIYAPLRGLAAGIKVIDPATNTVVNTIANPGANSQVIWGDFLGNVAASASVAVPVTEPIPNKVTRSFVPGIASQLTVLDMASGDGPTMTTCLLSTIKQMFGADAAYSGQSSSGAVQVVVAGQTISFYPLGANRIVGSGVSLRSDNLLNVGTSCGTFNIVPAVANMAELGTALTALGLSTQVSSEGVFTALVNDNLYAVRPDYFVTKGAATGAPILQFGADGVLRFTDSAGNVQILRAAFLDTALLQSSAGSALGGSLLIQTDGSALFTMINGTQLVLAPEMVMRSAATVTGTANWINDRPSHYMYRIVSYYQGMTAVAR